MKRFAGMGGGGMFLTVFYEQGSLLMDAVYPYFLCVNMLTTFDARFFASFE